MILHLLQWYLLIGCVAMGINITIISASDIASRTDGKENDELRLLTFIGLIVSYFIWPYYISAWIKDIRVFMKKITK